MSSEKDGATQDIFNAPISAPAIPEGVVGKLCSWIMASSPRPLKETAIITTLGALAAICGRAWNICGAGLNLYLMMLADTGLGKDIIHSSLARIFHALQTRGYDSYKFVGQSELASGPSLISRLYQVSPCFIAPLGEIGFRLKEICSPRADRNNLSLKRALLDLYGRSGHGNVVPETSFSITSKVKDRKEIVSPAFSLVGESTVRNFFRSQSLDIITSGMLPRFIVFIFEGERPKYNSEHYINAQKIPIYILDQLEMLAEKSNKLNSRDKIINVEIETEANNYFSLFDKFCDYEINNSGSDITRYLWNRGHQKALKVAALLAIGNNIAQKGKEIVTMYEAKWAVNLIRWETTRLLMSYEQNEFYIDMPSRQVDAIIAMVREYKKMKKPYKKGSGTTGALYAVGIIPYTWLEKKTNAQNIFRQCKRSPRGKIALYKTLDSLVECGFFEKRLSIREMDNIMKDSNESARIIPTEGYVIGKLTARPLFYVDG